MKKWDNFQASLKNLSAIYDEKPPYDVVTRTGMVALFQICFEQSWKAMKEILEEQGYTEFALGSPKRVIRRCLAGGPAGAQQCGAQLQRTDRPVDRGADKRKFLPDVLHAARRDGAELDRIA